MKPVLLSIALLSAVSIGTPGYAQYQGGSSSNRSGNYRGPDGPDAEGDFSARIGRLQERLGAGVQSGAISRQEAVPLRAQLRQLTQLERQYSVNGLDGRERADLQQRLGSLRQQIRVAGGAGQGGYGQDDRDDEYGRNGRNDRVARDGRNDRVARDGGRYDDGDYDRDDRSNDRGDDPASDRDDQPPVQRGGLGGLLDSVLGGGGLRVGQRAPDNLNGLPSTFRSQYRDGNGVYYRSDGRSIYEIDARSQAIVDVHPMSR